MKNYIPQWYLVTFEVNGEIHTEEMSTIETEPKTILADFNTELDDRFYGENRNIIEWRRILTPEDMKIEGLEEYYNEEKSLLLPNN